MGKLDSIEFLKIRVLVSLLKMSPENCNVTNLSKTLGVEKYTVSRVFTALEKDGYLNRMDSRHPRLEKLGEQTARKYAERMDIATNHLIYEGVTEAQACNDALYLSMYCSDETFEVIRSMEEQYRMKHLLRTYERFDGTILCNGLRDGQYLLPFIIYRETVKNGSNISMSNEGFIHPCTLSVTDGRGMILLKAQRVEKYSAMTGRKMSGKIKCLKYFDGSKFCEAQRNGDLISFPASVLEFVNIGSDSGRIFHGSVCLKMTCSVGIMHMPESTAIFTLLF